MGLLDFEWVKKGKKARKSLGGKCITGFSGNEKNDMIRACIDIGPIPRCAGFSATPWRGSFGFIGGNKTACGACGGWRLEPHRGLDPSFLSQRADEALDDVVAALVAANLILFVDRLGAVGQRRQPL